jgi:hypothetical protein
LFKVACHSKHGVQFRISTKQIVATPAFGLILKKGNDMTADGSPTTMIVRPKQGFAFFQFVKTYLNCSKDNIVVSFSRATSYGKSLRIKNMSSLVVNTE